MKMESQYSRKAINNGVEPNQTVANKTHEKNEVSTSKKNWMKLKLKYEREPINNGVEKAKRDKLREQRDQPILEIKEQCQVALQQEISIKLREEIAAKFQQETWATLKQDLVEEVKAELIPQLREDLAQKSKNLPEDISPASILPRKPDQIVQDHLKNKKKLSTSMKRRLQQERKIRRENENKVIQMLKGDDDNYHVQQPSIEGAKLVFEKQPIQIQTAQSLSASILPRKQDQIVQDHLKNKKTLSTGMKRRLQHKRKISRQNENKVMQMLNDDDDNYHVQQPSIKGAKLVLEKQPTQIQTDQSLITQKSTEQKRPIKEENKEEIRPNKVETKEDIITELKALEKRTEFLKQKLRNIEEKESNNIAQKRPKYDIEENRGYINVKIEEGDKRRKHELDVEDSDSYSFPTVANESSSSPNNLHKEIDILHREVAKCVKKRLDMYMVGQDAVDPNKVKIKDIEEYIRLAKFFSHKMRAQIKETYEQYNRSLEGVAITEDNKEQIKVEIDMYFYTRPMIK